MNKLNKIQKLQIVIIFVALLIIILSSSVSADYLFYPEKVNSRIRVYEIAEETLSIENNNPSPITGYVSLEGNISDFVTLSNDTIKIDANSNGTLNLNFFGKSANESRYEGDVVITGDIQKKIPVVFETYGNEDPRTATIMLSVSLLDSVVTRGEDIKFKVDALNLLSEQSKEVQLSYKIMKIEGSDISNITLYEDNGNATVLRSYTEVKSITIPRNTTEGDYVLRVAIYYNEQTSTIDSLFTVNKHIYEENLFGVLPVWFFSLLLTLFFTTFVSYRVYKKRQDAKKRFHAKIEYDLLPQEGPRSLFVGNIAETNKRAYVDMDVLTVHSIVAGSTGGGKSISAQDIIEEALLKGVAVAVFDPTAQWSGMLRKLEDKKFLEFYSQFGMDAKKDPRGFNGNIKAVKNGREIIDIFKYMKPGEIQIFTTNTLDPKDYDIFVASMIQQVFHSKLDEFRGLKYMLVFDEIHRILPKFGGSGAGFTQIERGCREFRKWGIGIVLISQVLSDFVGEIKANINTQVQMKTRDDGDLGRIKEQYGEEYIQSLVKSPVGSGMIQNSNWNRGRPYYVTFRPILHSVVRLSDDELEKYNHFNSIVEQMEFELDQLEGLKQDVFDLRLELKLAKDKIKSGNFNMVGIYLDGLSPRVVKMWDKLGKKPEKLQIKLLDASLIDEAVNKAKKERAAIKKDEPAKAAEQKEEKKLTPEEIKQKEEQMNELIGQISTALERNDKSMANELYNELPSIIFQFPDDKKKEWAAKHQAIKAKIGA